MNSGWTEVLWDTAALTHNRLKFPKKHQSFCPSFRSHRLHLAVSKQTAATNLRACGFLSDRPEGVHYRDVAQPPGNGQSAVPILQRDTHRQTETDTETQRDTHGDTHGCIGTDRHTNRTQGDQQRHTETQRDRHGERHREPDTETHTQTQRQRNEKGKCEDHKTALMSIFWTAQETEGTLSTDSRL